MTGLIRDENGEKMSKSKGNVIDPIDMIDGIDLESLVEKRTNSMMQPQLATKIAKNTRKTFENGIEPYGTDALRFTLAAMASTGRDIKWDIKRLEGYRNFCNKLWNASRYVLMNTEGKDCGMDGGGMAFSLADKWIDSQFELAAKDFNAYIDIFRLDMAANTIYEFIWNQFCDWYLELTKPVLWKGIEEQKRAARHTLITVLEKTLRLAHPVIPYITEAIWQSVKPLVNGIDGNTIMMQPLPQYDEANVNQEAIADIEWLKAFITSVRNLRAQYDVAPSKPLDVMIKLADANDQKRLAANRTVIISLATLGSIKVMAEDEKPTACATALVGNSELVLPMVDLIDKDAELKRLKSDLNRTEGEIKRIKDKLSNDSFIAKAPETVVSKERDKLESYRIDFSKIKEQISLMYDL